MVGAERLTFQRAITELPEKLCPKTGSNASNYIKITFSTAKSI